MLTAAGIRSLQIDCATLMKLRRIGKMQKITGLNIMIMFFLAVGCDQVLD